MDQLLNNNPQEIIPLKPKRRWYKRWWGIIIIIFVAYFLLTFILLIFAKNNSQTQTDLNPAGISRVNEDQLYLNTGNDPGFGKKDSKLKIVEFADFQCPSCRQSFPIVRELLQAYGDKIYFIFRDFPVQDLHQDAFKAAEAGQCAGEQNKFWPLHDKIFINQENIKVDDLKRYAAEIGLNTAQFNNCLDSDKYSSEVTQDYLDGVALGVRGTPTFFIQGYRVPGSIPKDIFVKIIEQAIKEAK